MMMRKTWRCVLGILWVTTLSVQTIYGATMMIFERGVCASDHRGRDLRDLLTAAAIDGVTFDYLGEDLGGSLDYPDQVPSVVRAVLGRPGTLGVLICGSGQGMVMTANRVKGIRAALCHDVETAKKARAHNDANVLVLGRDYVSDDEARAIVRTFMNTPFEGGRHQARIQKIDQIS
jgi:ribose 5-phosphate isomerase B